MDTTTPKSAPSGSRSPGPRRLRRGSDKKIAGVCDGVGRHFGIDPTIIRILFVAAAVLGGSGVVLYLVAWLVMPAPDAPPGDGIEMGGGSHNAAGLVVLAIGAVLLFWIIGPGPSWEVTIPLLLIGTGIAVLVRDPDAHPRDDDPQPMTAITPETDDDDGPATPSEPDVADTYPPPPPMDTAPVVPPPPAAPPESYVSAGPAPDTGPEADLEDSTVITPLVMSLLLLGGGVALALHIGEWVDVSALAVVSGGLVLIGVGLVVSAFVGRARGLIGLGVLFALAVPVTAAVEPALEDGVGDRTYVVDDLAELRDRYALGIGELVVDLSGLDVAGETLGVRVDLSIGNAEIVVPDDVDVEFRGDVDAGRIEFLGEPGDRTGGVGDRRSEDGLGVEVAEAFRVAGNANGTIVIDATVDLGNLEVHRS